MARTWQRTCAALRDQSIRPSSFLSVNTLWLEDGDAAVQGEGLHPLAHLARAAALLPDRAVGLREQADDRLGALEQGLERRLGEQAGAHHHQTHDTSTDLTASSG